MLHPLAPGVHRIATGRRDGENAFLVDGDDGMTLVDVGWAAAPRTISAAVAELGRSPRDVRRIVITHAHPDHVRGLAAMRAITGAAVAIHAADVAWLRAGRVAPGGRHARFGAVLDALPIMGWTPVKPDLELADGDLLDGVLRVVHVPGHTAGHIALLHEPSRTVLVGDALFHRSGLALGPAALAEDPAGRPAGLRALPPDVAAVGFAHGAPLSGTATEIYQQFLHERSAT